MNNLNNPQFYIDTYSVEQLKWIKSILCLNVGYTVSFDNIQNYLEQIEDDITESTLDVTTQQIHYDGFIIWQNSVSILDK